MVGGGAPQSPLYLTTSAVLFTDRDYSIWCGVEQVGGAHFSYPFLTDLDHPSRRSYVQRANAYVLRSHTNAVSLKTWNPNR